MTWRMLWRGVISGNVQVFGRRQEENSDDSGFPLASGTPPATRLGSLTLQSPISFSTSLADSPFFRLREEFSDSGQSIAEQYEFMVLQRG